MKITKYGQSCLKIEIRGTNFLVDPGSYVGPDANFGKIDAILITHGHQDHLDVDLLKKVLVDNSARIYANRSVVEQLKTEGIKAKIIKAGDSFEVNGVPVEVFGELHEPVYHTMEAGENVASLIDKKLFLPGDSYADPKREIEVLALALSGPWVRLSEAIDYAAKLKPKTVIPVHDGNILDLTASYRIPEKLLTELGIKFEPLELNKLIEL